ITSLKWLETNNLFNNLIQRNQSAAFSSGKVRPNHETNINIIARRTGKDEIGRASCREREEVHVDADTAVEGTKRRRPRDTQRWRLRCLGQLLFFFQAADGIRHRSRHSC